VGRCAAALEEAPQLVGEGHLLGDEVVAAADEGSKRQNAVALRRQRAQAVAVGAQDVGEHEGVAGIALGAGGAVAWPTGLEQVGVDRDERMAGGDEAIDDEPRRPLDGDGQPGGGAITVQAREPGVEAGAVVADLEAVDDGAAAVDDANGVAQTVPIQPDEHGHGHLSSASRRVTRAGRSCGSRTERRSGWPALAHHPVVVRRGRPAPAARRVSRGPSSGERRRPSRPLLGPADATPLRRFASAGPKVHQ
jgi:hypothetical protein